MLESYQGVEMEIVIVDVEAQVVSHCNATVTRRQLDDNSTTTRRQLEGTSDTDSKRRQVVAAGRVSWLLPSLGLMCTGVEQPDQGTNQTKPLR